MEAAPGDTQSTCADLAPLLVYIVSWRPVPPSSHYLPKAPLYCYMTLSSKFPTLKFQSLHSILEGAVAGRVTKGPPGQHSKDQDKTRVTGTLIPSPVSVQHQVSLHGIPVLAAESTCSCSMLPALLHTVLSLSSWRVCSLPARWGNACSGCPHSDLKADADLRLGPFPLG